MTKLKEKERKRRCEAILKCQFTNTETLEHIRDAFKIFIINNSLTIEDIEMTKVSQSYITFSYNPKTFKFNGVDTLYRKEYNCDQGTVDNIKILGFFNKRLTGSTVGITIRSTRVSVSRYGMTSPFCQNIYSIYFGRLSRKLKRFGFGRSITDHYVYNGHFSRDLHHDMNTQSRIFYHDTSRITGNVSYIQARFRLSKGEIPTAFTGTGVIIYKNSEAYRGAFNDLIPHDDTMNADYVNKDDSILSGSFYNGRPVGHCHITTLIDTRPNGDYGFFYSITNDIFYAPIGSYQHSQSQYQQNSQSQSQYQKSQPQPLISNHQTIINIIE
jgi:hypothetical protein